MGKRACSTTYLLSIKFSLLKSPPVLPERYTSPHTLYSQSFYTATHLLSNRYSDIHLPLAPSKHSRKMQPILFLLTALLTATFTSARPTLHHRHRHHGLMGLQHTHTYAQSQTLCATPSSASPTSTSEPVRVRVRVRAPVLLRIMDDVIDVPISDIIEGAAAGVD